MILQFDRASIATVGVIIGLMFLGSGVWHLTVALLADRLRWLKFIGIPLGLFLLFLIVGTLWNVEPLRAGALGLEGSPKAIGSSLFSDYLLPFELTSLLILIALMGAVIFAKKDL